MSRPIANEPVTLTNMVHHGNPEPSQRPIPTLTEWRTPEPSAPPTIAHSSSFMRPTFLQEAFGKDTKRLLAELADLDKPKLPRLGSIKPAPLTLCLSPPRATLVQKG